MSYLKAQGRDATARLAGSEALFASLRALLGVVSAEASAQAPEDVALLKSALEHGDVTCDELAAIVRLRKRARQLRLQQPSTNEEPLPPLLPLRPLLGGVTWPVDPVPEQDPELLKRRAWLLARAAARDYAAKTANLPVSGVMSLNSAHVLGRGGVKQKASQGPISEAREVYRELTVGLAMILVCVGVFFAFKTVSENRGHSRGTSIVAGLCGGIAMLFIEMVLYIIRMTRLEGFERKRTKFLEKETLTNLSGIVQPRKAKGTAPASAGGKRR